MMNAANIEKMNALMANEEFTQKIADAGSYENAYALLAENGVDATYEEFTAKVKIKCFDNVITVWIDDVLVLRYTDNTQALNAKGSIGFVFLECAVKIDNIQVVEETDLLGGSYDNEICGNWNEEIPSLVQEYIDKKYYGYSAAPYVKKEDK